MIDELKLLLDQMKNVPDVALWILGGFLLYKLVTYLSMTGAVVYIVRLLCGTFLGHANKPKNLSLHSLVINEDVEIEIRDLLREIRSTGYVHSSDVKELRKAWTAHKTTKGK